MEGEESRNVGERRSLWRKRGRRKTRELSSCGEVPEVWASLHGGLLRVEGLLIAEKGRSLEAMVDDYDCKVSFMNSGASRESIIQVWIFLREHHDQQVKSMKTFGRQDVDVGVVHVGQGPSKARGCLGAQNVTYGKFSAVMHGKGRPCQ